MVPGQTLLYLPNHFGFSAPPARSQRSLLWLLGRPTARCALGAERLLCDRRAEAHIWVSHNHDRSAGLGEVSRVTR